MNKIQRILLTLVSLFIVTASWSQYTVEVLNTKIVASSGVLSTSSSNSYKISIPGGNIVTLTVTPASGEYLSTLTVIPHTGGGSASARQTRSDNGPTINSSVTITPGSDANTFTFTMPTYDVKVNANFGTCTSINNTTVTLNNNNETTHVFDFLSHTPALASVKDGNTTLTEGKDYIVSSSLDNTTWTDGITGITNVGTLTIKLTGKGKYNGTKDISYTITPRSIEDATINLSDNNFLYLKDANQVAHINGVYINGQTLTQGGTINGYEILGYYVGDYSSSTATLPTDPATPYTSSTIPSENAGTYTIVIKGKGNFDPNTRARTKYIINKKDISTCTVTTTPTNASFIYDGESKTLGVTVIDTNGKELSSGVGNDYTLSGNTKTATGGYTATVSANNINYTGSIDVPFTINVSNDGYYICSIADQTYTGGQIKPDELSPSQITVKKMVNATPDDNDPVLSSSYYRIVYSNNINVGIATVTAIGKGGYDFMATQTFKIIQKNINNASVTVDLDDNESFTYNGSVQKPTMTVKDGTMTLVENKDYTYAGETNAGTHAITISGMGNYNGTKTFNASGDDKFTIQQLSLNGANITLSNSSYVYDGTAKTPTVEQVKIGTFIVPSTEYTYTGGYSNNTAAGTATVTVSPSTTGNLSDSKTANYTIDRKPVSDLNITLSSTTFSYNGSAQGPTVDVYDPGIIVSSNPKKLTKDTDYTLTFNSGVDSDGKPLSSAVGSYTVTITGTGNYIGSVTKTYVINYGTSDSEFIVTVLGTHTYTGNKITPAGTNDGNATEGVLVKRKVGTNPDSYPILDPATDYTLTYSNNTNAGTATVIATGKNNYQFVQTAEFTIDKQSVNVAGTSISISYPSSATSLTYNGSPQTPIVSVTDANSRVMTEGTDFTVNEGATNAGNHTVTITGIGNYKDSKTSTATYTISKLDITEATITLASSNYFFDDTAKEPSVEQVKKGSVIVPASDYDVEYSNNTNKGTATVTVKPGTINLSATTNPSTTFEINARALTESMVTLPYASVQYDGTAKIPVPTVSDIPSGKTASIITADDYEVTYSDNTNVGTATVTVTAKRNYSGVVKKTFKIVEKDASGIFTVALADGATTTFTYNGSPHTPAVKVTKTGTTTELNLDTDYSVDYSDNTNAGTAKITVTGKGNYQGTVVFQFTINPKPITALASTDITLSATSYNYDGSDHKPTVTVKDGTTKTLVENIDYTLTYPSDLRSQGDKTITISGIGNYGGSVNMTYTINKIYLTTATIDLPALSYVYNRAEQKPVPVVRVGTLVISTNDYDIRWDNDNDENNTADVTNIGTKTVYITGKNNCEGATSINYTITAKTLISSMVTLTYTEMTYTGSDLNPGITVKDGEATLTNDTEYTVTLTNNTNVGTATVTVQGIGNYTGTVQKTFSIQTTASGAFTISDIAAYTFDNTEHKPTPTVSKGGTDLTLDKDYTLSYTNNKNAGTATVTVTGIGGYAGSNGSKTFTINPKTLTAAMVSLSNFTVTVDANHDTQGYTFNGSNQKPNVTIADAAAKITADDYDIINAGGTNVGDYTVTVTGKGNYTTGGSPISITYRIYQRDLSASTVILNQLASYIYDGSNKEPGVKQVTFGSEVVASTDYTVVHSNNKNAGTATVTVTGQNNHTGTKTATFTIQKKTLANNMITFDQETFNYDGSNKAPTVTMQDMSGSNNIINQASDCDISIPTSSAVGTYTVNVSAKETGNYSGSASRQYSIIPEGAAAFDIAWTGGSAPSPTYDGNAQEPAVTVTNHSTNTALNASDYDIAYSNNKNAGTATVTVTGKANYSGTKTLYFTINKKPMTDAMLTLTGGPFTYNGSVQKPTATVSDGACPITTNDYVINNEGNINAGTHTVTATATDTGNYSGSSSKTYTISPYALTTENTTITLNQTSLVYDGTAKTPEVQLVKVGSDLVVPTYTTVYANNTNAAAATAATAPQVTVTGTGNFTGNAVKKFTIIPKTVTSDMLSFNKEFFTYNGSLQKPTVTVKDGNNPMTETIDYTLTNDGGTNVGTYYVYIDGNGNYQGRASRAFNIVTEGASMFSVEDIASVTFDGTYQEPTVTVKDNTNSPGTPLTKNTHYTITYVNNRNAGTASVILTGIGSYAGTITKNFTINPKLLTEAMVSVSETSFTYNSLVQSPTVTVSDGTIMTDNDYTITNNGGIGCGTYHVIVTGKGNYSGQIDKTFDITQLDISNASVTLYELQSYAYDGKAKKPGVREVMVGSVTVPTTGYTISYGENINAGTATVTVTGQGDFKGSKTVNFTIEKKAVTDNMIILSNLEYTYNGNVQKPEVSVKDGETTLTLDTDYTLDNNGGVNAGVYDVKITGKGNYTGSAFKSFYINTREAGNFVVTLSEESMVYSGSELKPEVTVEDGGNTLTAGKDYTVTYNDNINVGVATITVRGMGEYDGIKNKTFIIKPKELKAEMVTLGSSGFTYNGMQQRPVVTVADGTFLTSNDYVVTNEGGINAGSYPVKVTGRNNYTGTVETSFSIGALDLAEAKVILYDLANYEYDGSPKNPGVREVAVGTMVVPTSSYTTEISANVNVGTVTVTVTGTGNFAGSASTTFEILQKPITTSMITLTPDIFYYNGSTQKPAVTVKHGKLTLREGTDFTLTNNGGRDAGTYEVKVKGMGNYTDEASASYNILTSEVTIFEITLETEKYVYDGTAREPAVTVKEGERVLTAVTDYTVKYANNVNAGTATVAVIGVGDYKGSQMKEFIIEPKPMTEDMVSLDKTTFTYNEEKQKPVVTVSDGDIMTEADYTITNEGGAEVGAYEVVVKGKNNYNGTITKKYNIVRSEMPVDPKPGEEQPGDAKINVSPTEEGSNEVKVSSITTSETGDASVTIPETCTINGQTYTVTGIADGAFASASNLKDIYLPETEKPLTIGKNAIPVQTNVHVPLALLAEYALMPTMAESFRNGKVMSTVKAKNRYWTFASGVDVYVPDGLDVYIAREHNGNSVSIIQLTDNELAVGGQRVIKANNGVLINSSGNDTEYVFVACAKRMTSGTAVSTDDNKDYGLRNCLIPVIVATHFEAGNYYFMKDNEFYRIKDESEDIKVPAGKAVLYMKSANASARVRLINGTTDINSENIAEDEGEWYTLEGMKLEGRPTKEGIYIHNKKKVYIRKYEK